MKKYKLKIAISNEQSVQKPHPHGAYIPFGETINKSANYSRLERIASEKKNKGGQGISSVGKREQF